MPHFLFLVMMCTLWSFHSCLASNLFSLATLRCTLWQFLPFSGMMWFNAHSSDVSVRPSDPELGASGHNQWSLKFLPEHFYLSYSSSRWPQVIPRLSFSPQYLHRGQESPRYQHRDKVICHCHFRHLLATSGPLSFWGCRIRHPLTNYRTIFLP